MIPKIIHYCWMSGDIVPEQFSRCMDSWHKALPDYEFMLWNYDRFPKGQSKWVDDAFDRKMYAFCSDYIRLYALYNYGGIYLDMDVEVVRDFGSLLRLNTMVSCQNKLKGLELAAFGVEKGCTWVKVLLDEYDKRNFLDEMGNCDDEPMPYFVERILKKNGILLKKVCGCEEALEINDAKVIPVLPSEYLSPKSFLENKIESTENTCCVHHFAGTWTDRPGYELMEQKFWNHLGLPNFFILSRLLNLFTMRSNFWGKYKKKRKGL